VKRRTLIVPNKTQTLDGEGVLRLEPEDVQVFDFRFLIFRRFVKAIRPVQEMGLLRFPGTTGENRKEKECS
jgi:hypothetical protein